MSNFKKILSKGENDWSKHLKIIKESERILRNSIKNIKKKE